MFYIQSNEGYKMEVEKVTKVHFTGLFIFKKNCNSRSAISLSEFVDGP